jgi:diacylglycerol kinase
MRSYWNSLRYALSGLTHALKTERNLKLFVALYVLSFVIGAILGIRSRDWEILIFTGGVFIAVELMNTAIEHFTDAFDIHSNKLHKAAVKATKDIAAAASLVCAVAWGLTLLMIYLPYVLSIVKSF